MKHGSARGRRSAIVVVFVGTYFVSYFFRSTNAVIADDLVRDVGLTAGALGLMTSLFFITFALVQLPLGSALDRFGSRWVTSVLLLAAVLGSAIFAASTTLTGLVIGRGLIGVGMAGVLMGALKAFSSWFDPRSFATVSGLLVGIGSLGALAAATPLALLNEAVGWRVVFVGAALVTLVAAAAVALVVREPEGGGFATPAAGTSLADVFRSGRFWRLAGLTFAMAGTLFAYQGLWAGPYLTQRLGLGAVETGNVLVAMALATSAGFLGAGPIANRIGLARGLGVSAVLLVASLVALLLLDPSSPRWLVVVAFAALGLGGSGNVLCFALARASFPHMPGRAVTAVNLFGIGGGALMQWGLGAVIGRYPANASGHAPPEAFTAAVVVSIAVATAALFAYAPLVRTHTKP